MSDIKIDVVDQNLIITNAPLIASGGVNEDRVIFKFDSTWNDFGKIAIFYNEREGQIYKVAINADGIATIPAQVSLNPGKIYIGAVGAKDDVTKTSEIVFYEIVEGAIYTGEVDPPQDIYEQILTISGQMTSLYNALQNDLEAEKSARESADSTLQSNINSEKSARESADSELQSDLDAEVTARTNATEFRTSLLTLAQDGKYVDSGNSRYIKFGRICIVKIEGTIKVASTDWYDIAYGLPKPTYVFPWNLLTNNGTFCRAHVITDENTTEVKLQIAPSETGSIGTSFVYICD